MSKSNGGWKRLTPHLAKIALAMRQEGTTKQAGLALGLSRETVATAMRSIEMLFQLELFERSKGLREPWYRIDTVRTARVWKTLEATAAQTSPLDLNS